MFSEKGLMRAPQGEHSRFPCCCLTRAIPWQSHAEQVGQALGRRGRKGLHPSSRGGCARCAATACQPGYDGLPGGAQEFTAVRIPRRMARPFEWATRRSRVGTDRFGTGPVGTGCGEPTRLRRVARRRAGPARPVVSITIRITIRTLSASTTHTTKREYSFQLPPKKHNHVTFMAYTLPQRGFKFTILAQHGIMIPH